MLSLIDTHSHLYTEEFDADRAAAYERALAAGVTGLLLPNIDEASIAPMMQLVGEHPDVCFPMMGLHPTELPDNPEPLLARMEQMLENENPFVAIGEVGIDLYWDTERREEQISVFRRQIEWSVRFGLPLMIHSRSAHRDLIETLLPYKADIPAGVFHCFGGSAEEAEELLQTFPQFVLGIGGVVTFKKSTLPAVLKQCVPLDRIVLETDDPYLAPTPHRGTRNEPAYLPLVVDKLAEVYDTTPERIAATTRATTLRVFPKVKFPNS